MQTFIAVDIGNSAVKVAGFRMAAADLPPEPEWVDVWPEIGEPLFARLDRGPVSWWIASVHRGKEARLLELIADRRPQDAAQPLSFADADIEIRVPSPQRVGEDRVFAAVTANRLRQPQQPAVVVDTGSAITIDAIDASGAFTGGAILPGLMMSARSLHRETDALPEIQLPDDSPPLVGSDTTEAMQTGIVRGAAGAIRFFAESMTAELQTEPLKIISGGDSQRLLPLLGEGWTHLPHLVVQGVAITAMRSISET